MERDLWPKQLTRIAQRWPELAQQLENAAACPEITWRTDLPQPTLIVEGLHLASGYDALAEAELQASVVPETADVCWIYGLGAGYLPAVLARRTHLKQIHVILLNPSVARACLAHFAMGDWLDDPRVEIRLASEATPLQRPFAAIPPCLLLASNEAASLRDRVWLDLSTPFIQSKQADTEERWQLRLKENEALMKADGDAADFRGACAGGQVLVAGAGPSLSDYAPILAKRGDTPLIATSSALRPLALAGVVPDLVIVIDGDEVLVWPHFDSLELLLFETVPLIYFPRVHSSVLKRWPGPRYVAYPQGTAFDGQARRLPKQRLFCSGSVLHPAVDLAIQMGAVEIVLFGADFGFPEGCSHATGSAHNRRVGEGFAGHRIRSVQGEMIATSASMRGYLRDLEDYIVKHPDVRFVTVTRSGAAVAGAEHCQEIGAAL